MDQSIKNQTTPPEYGTLAGELPKEFTDQMSKDLREALHVGECDPGPDIEAIKWAHQLISVNWVYIFGTGAPRKDATQMLRRLLAMLETK